MTQRIIILGHHDPLALHKAMEMLQLAGMDNHHIITVREEIERLSKAFERPSFEELAEAVQRMEVPELRHCAYRPIVNKPKRSRKGNFNTALNRVICKEAYT